jgi:hypothetical protein
LRLPAQFKKRVWRCLLDHFGEVDNVLDKNDFYFSLNNEIFIYDYLT